MKLKPLNYIFLALGAAIYGLIAVSTALASGIQVSPAELKFENYSQKPASLTLTVVNPSADVQVFEIYPDDFKNIISVSPESFTLESGAQKLVAVTVKPKNNSYVSTTLSIISKPLAESKLQFATGAKIPLTISYEAVRSKSKNIPFIIGGGILLAVLAYFAGKRKIK
jgi:hypothetical protein